MSLSVQFRALGPDLEELDRFVSRSFIAARDSPVSPPAFAVEEEAIHGTRLAHDKIIIKTA